MVTKVFLQEVVDEMRRADLLIRAFDVLPPTEVARDYSYYEHVSIFMSIPEDAGFAWILGSQVGLRLGSLKTLASY